MILPEFSSIHHHILCKSTLYQEYREIAHDTSTTQQQQWETRRDDWQRTILTWRQRPHTSLGFINGSPNVILAHQTPHTPQHHVSRVALNNKRTRRWDWVERRVAAVCAAEPSIGGARRPDDLRHSSSSLHTTVSTHICPRAHCLTLCLAHHVDLAHLAQ